VKHQEIENSAYVPGEAKNLNIPLSPAASRQLLFITALFGFGTI